MLRRLFKGFLAVVIVSIFAAVVLTKVPAKPRPAGLQSQPAPPRQPDPPGTIDGSKNPELIPDEVAYKMLFLVLFEPENATEAQKARQQAKINQVGLSEEDSVALLTVTAEFHRQMTAIDSQAAEVLKRNPSPHPASADWQLLAQLQKQKDQLVPNGIAALAAALSAEGTRKLLLHLPNVKRGIKRIPMPKAATR